MSASCAPILPFEIGLRALQRGDPRERNDPLIGKRLELRVFLTDALELGARGLALRAVSLDLALRLSDTFFEDRYLDPSCSAAFLEPPLLVAHRALR